MVYDITAVLKNTNSIDSRLVHLLIAIARRFSSLWVSPVFYRSFPGYEEGIQSRPAFLLPPAAL